MNVVAASLERAQAYENEITKLRETIQAQAAVIESNKEVFEYLLNQLGDIKDIKIVKAALAIPTDSTQILDEVRRAERERVYQVADNAYATEHVLLAIRAMAWMKWLTHLP